MILKNTITKGRPIAQNTIVKDNKYYIVTDTGEIKCLNFFSMKLNLIISYAFLICLFLFNCRNVNKKLNEEKLKSDTVGETELPTTQDDTYYIDTIKFKFSCDDTLDLRFASTNKYYYKKNLLKLTDKDKKLYFQQFYNQFNKSDLYFFAHLKCNSYSKSMIFLDIQKTTYRLVRINFNRHRKYLPRLNFDYSTSWWYNYVGGGLYSSVEYSEISLFDFYKPQYVDTLIASFKNKAAVQEEYTAPHSKPYFGTRTTINTKQIDKSTYLIDTFKDREYVNSIIFNRTKFKQNYAIRNIIPKGKNIFREAIGDLNGDGIDDYVFILEDNEDYGASNRHLLIVFTTPRGFKIKTFIEDCFSCKQCGGFYDPIDGTQDSGISILKGKLTYKYFGGSAWKWEGDLKFAFSTDLNDFFLIQERGRWYHSINIYEHESELPYIEKVQKGIKLTKEEQEEYKHAKKGLEDYKYKVTNYKIGKKSIYDALKSEGNY